MKYHGALSSLTCILNHRFTLLIVQAGFAYLAKKSDPPQRKGPFLRRSKEQAEETIFFSDEKSNDIKNFGSILNELFGEEFSEENGEFSQKFSIFKMERKLNFSRLQGLVFWKTYRTGKIQNFHRFLTS
jgi:hypothetical protein